MVQGASFPRPVRLRFAVVFAAATPEDSHRAVLAGRFTPLDVHLPNPPLPAGAFFDRAFASDAAERPSSVRALLGDLERALAYA